jgi:hypothetical protein
MHVLIHAHMCCCCCFPAQDTFIKSLAFVLGINPARICVANVVAGRRRLAQATPAATASGAALVSVEIGEDPAPKPEAPFNMTYNLDMGTSLQVSHHCCTYEQGLYRYLTEAARLQSMR